MLRILNWNWKNPKSFLFSTGFVAADADMKEILYFVNLILCTV
jgi:hypothetical protein